MKNIICTLTLLASFTAMAQFNRYVHNQWDTNDQSKLPLPSQVITNQSPTATIVCNTNGTFVLNGVVIVPTNSLTMGVQEAINSLPLASAANTNLPGGGTISFSPGLYKIGSTLVTPNNGTAFTLVFAGAGESACGLLLTNLNPMSLLTVSANSNNAATVFVAKDMFFMSVSNAATNIVALLGNNALGGNGGMSSADFERCWFSWWSGITNMPGGSFSPTISIYGTGYNLLPIYIDVNWASNMRISRCNFNYVNSVSLAYDHFTVCDSVWNNIGGGTLWPTNSPYRAGAAIIIRDPSDASWNGNKAGSIHGNTFVSCVAAYLNMDNFHARGFVSYDDAFEDCTYTVLTTGGPWTLFNPNYYGAGGLELYNTKGRFIPSHWNGLGYDADYTQLVTDSNQLVQIASPLRGFDMMRFNATNTANNFAGNGANLTNLTHSSTLTSSNSSVTLAITVNADGSKNYDLAAIGGGISQAALDSSNFVSNAKLAGSNYLQSVAASNYLTSVASSNYLTASSNLNGANITSGTIGVVAIGFPLLSNSVVVTNFANLKPVDVTGVLPAGFSGTLNTNFGAFDSLNLAAGVNTNRLHSIAPQQDAIYGLNNNSGLGGISSGDFVAMILNNGNTPGNVQPILKVKGDKAFAQGLLSDGTTEAWSIRTNGFNGSVAGTTNYYATNLITSEGIIAPTSAATNYTINLFLGGLGNCQIINTANTNAWLTFTGTNLFSAGRTICFDALTSSVPCNVMLNMIRGRTNTSISYSFTVTNGTMKFVNLWNRDTSGTNIVISNGSHRQ